MENLMLEQVDMPGKKLQHVERQYWSRHLTGTSLEDQLPQKQVFWRGLGPPWVPTELAVCSWTTAPQGKRPTLVKLLKYCTLWEGLLTGAGLEQEEEGVTEMNLHEIPIPCSCTLLRGRTKKCWEWSWVWEEEKGRVKVFVHCFPFILLLQLISNIF